MNVALRLEFLARWTYLELEVTYAVTSEHNQLICVRCCGAQQNRVTILAVTDEIHIDNNCFSCCLHGARMYNIHVQDNVLMGMALRYASTAKSEHYD